MLPNIWVSPSTPKFEVCQKWTGTVITSLWRKFQPCRLPCGSSGALRASPVGKSPSCEAGVGPKACRSLADPLPLKRGSAAVWLLRRCTATSPAALCSKVWPKLVERSVRLSLKLASRSPLLLASAMRPVVWRRKLRLKTQPLSLRQPARTIMSVHRSCENPSFGPCTSAVLLVGPGVPGARQAPLAWDPRSGACPAGNNAALSSRSDMPAAVPDLAQVRLDNALRLFEEFVRATARHADAATLRGLERRFAEQVDIQPSYWSQLKSRSRQIGERLARQFETRCHKPFGWMDQRHDLAPPPAEAVFATASQAAPATRDDSLPADDDERFIVGLVLTYYRRHPQRARNRLLDLLGEVLTPGSDAAMPASTRATLGSAPVREPAPAPRLAPGVTRPPRPATPAATVDDPHALWLQSQTGVAPLKPKK
jgi:hypothetical protein